ncbi:MAG: hypothetical protein WBA05_15580 [Gordonia sp. (in: high G+C Gram-positive bacteria)]|uniref:hypothetical protein n=1 Tax=Gordonia TaxID=2053 RepID=UPI0032677D19
MALTACSLINTDTTPSKIVIPGTDAPSTQSPVSSLSATSASRTLGTRTAAASPWSYERVIKAAPRTSNSEFQTGATSPDGRRAEVSGYHFSTPDRGVRCSTGNNGADALACVSDSISGTRRPADVPDGCDWNRHYAILDANGAEAGACANSYPVLFRSRVLPSGTTFNVDRFACLTVGDDLYCIESGSGAGFAITADRFSTFRADERAPDSLLTPDSHSPSESSASDHSTQVVPTR